MDAATGRTLIERALAAMGAGGRLEMAAETVAVPVDRCPGSR
jgi:hypothetical protein